MASSGKNEGTLIESSPPLMWLSDELTAEWQDLGRILGISDGQLHSITENNRGNVKEAKYQMLICWKQTKGQRANYECLAEALIKVDRKDLAEKLQYGFNRNVNHQSVSTTPDLQGKKEEFLEDIKETYEDMYHQVRPVTYIDERCVNDVFIDSGIEYFNKEGRRIEGRGTWHRLNSYNSIFTDPRLENTKLCVLLGEPGYGKSTLALQFVYDWCTRCPDSPLKEVELLIFLRLRTLTGGVSIFKGIKQSLLPSDSSLTDDDIANIIKSCKSVVIVLDGFDEYPSQVDSSEDDVMKIIARRMLRNCKVVLTTRPSSTPPRLPHKTSQLRLNGFDDRAIERYILKAVVEGDSEAAAAILRRLQQSPAFAAICQVALFSVMFAHMTHERDMSVVFQSVTSFFRYIVSSFYEHKQIRAGAVSVVARDSHTAENKQLYKFAFESLRAKDRKLVWRRENLMKLIGQHMYDELVDIGIMVEENVVKIVDDPGTSAGDHIQRRTHVSFYHKLLCEWYAAHYVADTVGSCVTCDLEEFFAGIDSFELQYVYRIACGLNPAAADKIIQYLYSRKLGSNIAILCTLEKTGDVDKIKETLRQIFFIGFFTHSNKSILLQRSTMQSLEIAARHDVLIEAVIVFNCFQSVDLSTASIRFTSGLALTSRIPVKVLEIYLSKRDMTENEAIDILQFASMSPSLRKLRYIGSVPPRVFKNRSTLASLRSRDVEVTWRWLVGETRYNLNLQTGRWENKSDGSEPTEEDFERMTSRAVEYRKRCTELEKTYREDVKEGQNQLREQGEEDRTELKEEVLGAVHDFTMAIMKGMTRPRSSPT